MKKYYESSLLICLLLMIGIQISSAQVADEISTAKHVVHADAGTNIFLSSATLNAEVKFGSSKYNKINWYARGGIGGAAVFYGNTGFGALAGVTMLTGRGNHHFEASGGGFLGLNNVSGQSGLGFFALPLLDVGYRFQKPQKGFVFRAKVGILGIGIGLGYSF